MGSDPGRRSRRRRALAPQRLALGAGPSRRARPGSRSSGTAGPRRTVPRMRTASSPALRAPATETVATGTPAGIWTIESSESMPSRCSSGTGTPMTGSGVTRRQHARQVSRSPGARDDHPQPPTGRLLAVRQHLARHPVRRDDVDLERDVELLQRGRRGLHHRPVGVAAHDDADDGARAARSFDVSSEEGRRVPGTRSDVLSILADSRHVAHLSPRADAPCRTCGSARPGRGRGSAGSRSTCPR